MQNLIIENARAFINHYDDNQMVGYAILIGFLQLFKYK